MVFALGFNRYFCMIYFFTSFGLSKKKIQYEFALGYVNGYNWHCDDRIKLLLFVFWCLTALTWKYFGKVKI